MHVVRILAFTTILVPMMLGSAQAKNLPKSVQGLWVDNKLATCSELRAPDMFKDGGFVYIKGSEIRGPEWSCEAKRVLSNGEYSFACASEGYDFTGRGTVGKEGKTLVINWSQFGMGPVKREVWRFAESCGKKGPAFWGN